MQLKFFDVNCLLYVLSHKSACNWEQRSACTALGCCRQNVMDSIGPSGAVQTVSDSRRPLFCTYFGPSVDDQVVSLSDDGTTIIIDFFSLFFLLLPPLLKPQKGLP